MVNSAFIQSALQFLSLIFLLNDDNENDNNAYCYVIYYVPIFVNMLQGSFFLFLFLLTRLRVFFFIETIKKWKKKRGYILTSSMNDLTKVSLCMTS